MERIKPLEWIEVNPTMICQGPLVKKQPEVHGPFRGCSYCYAAAGLPQSPKEAKSLKQKEMTTEQLVDLFIQAGNLGVPRACILGGEPQARDDFDKVIGEACNRIPVVHLSTNGVGTEKHLEILLKVHILDISVDSCDSEVASKTRPPTLVEAAYKAIELLKDKHPFLCLNVVVTPQTLPTLWQTVDWAFEKGLKKVNLYPLLDGGQPNLEISSEDAAEIAMHARDNYPVIQETRCKGGEHVVVNSDGLIIPCAAFIGEDEVIGHVGNLGGALGNPLFLRIASYDYQTQAHIVGGDFVSPGCPAKKLYDANWEDGVFKVRGGVGKTKSEGEKYCMRCGMIHGVDVDNCKYCDFEHFDIKPLSMVCSCFSVMNPLIFS